ncbi:MAG: hypothetical protein RLZZ64_1464 [Bacteroidota bacterium]|jgi:hypothetical protein
MSIVVKYILKRYTSGMGIFEALPLMAQVKLSAHDKNHSLENFTVDSQVKFTSKCKICKKTVTVDLEAELPVSGEVLISICQKPERKKKIQISS